MKKLVLLFSLLMTSAFLVFAQQDSIQSLLVDTYISEISLYPNPTKQFIHLSSKSELDQSITVRVFNLMGNIELEKVFNPNQEQILELDLIHLKKGLYFVNIEVGERKVTRRIYLI